MALRNLGKLVRNISLSQKLAAQPAGLDCSVSAEPARLLADSTKRTYSSDSQVRSSRVDNSCCRLQIIRQMRVLSAGKTSNNEELSEKDYHRLSDLTLGQLLAKLEVLIEETPGIADSDLEYQQLGWTLRRIWFPGRSDSKSWQSWYDLISGKWIYLHDGHVFQERLAEELQQITGKDEIDLDQEPQIEKRTMGYGADPT